MEFAKLRRKFKIWRVLENSRTGGFKKGLRIGRFRELMESWKVWKKVGEKKGFEKGWFEEGFKEGWKIERFR